MPILLLLLLFFQPLIRFSTILSMRLIRLEEGMHAHVIQDF